MNKSLRCIPAVIRVIMVLAGIGIALVPAGCSGCRNDKVSKDPEGRTNLKVAYLGLTCEAPIFVAKEKGFFEEEGLNVELVKTDWNGLREGLGSGNFDANHTLIMYVLTAIEKD